MIGRAVVLAGSTVGTIWTSRGKVSKIKNRYGVIPLDISAFEV